MRTDGFGTRREFMLTAAAGPLAARTQTPIDIPIHHIVDSRARFRPNKIERFWSRIWPEAVRDLGRCGINLKSARKPGEVRRSPSGQPVFVGLESGVINFVITGNIPVQWDNGRGLTGVTTLYQGHHLCMVAANRANAHEVPLLAVNTCVHELLHVLMHDIFERRPSGWTGATREFRIDLYATRLWLFHEGAEIRKAAEAYLERLTKHA